MILSNRAKR